MAANTPSHTISSHTPVLLFSYHDTKKIVTGGENTPKQFDLSKPPLSVSAPREVQSQGGNLLSSWLSPKMNVFSVLFMVIITIGIPSFMWGYTSTPSGQIIQPVQAAETHAPSPTPDVAQSNLFVPIVSITVEPTSIPVPTPQPAAPQSIEEQARSIAREFNINEEVFVCTLRKESGLNSKWANGTLKCGDGGRSCGIAQIQLATWKSIRRHAGWSQDDLRADDTESMRTAAYGISTVWKYHWTGYRLCTS